MKVIREGATLMLSRFQRELVDRGRAHRRGDVLRIEERAVETLVAASTGVISFPSPRVVGGPDCVTAAPVRRPVMRVGNDVLPITYSAPIGQVVAVGGRPARRR